MNSEEFRETFLRNDREGPAKAEKAEKMAENNAWGRNSRRGKSQPRAAVAREAYPVGSVRSTGGEENNVPREAKRKAGLSGQKRKAGSPEKAKSGSRGAGGERPEKHSCSRPRGRARRPRERGTPHTWGCCMCLHAPNGRVT